MVLLVALVALFPLLWYLFADLVTRPNIEAPVAYGALTLAMFVAVWMIEEAVELALDSFRPNPGKGG